MMWDKMRKPAAGVLLTATMLLAACGSTGNNADNGQEAANGNAGAENASQGAIDPMGKYETPVEIKFARPSSQNWKYPDGDSLDDNIWSREYSDKLGIKVVTDWTAEEGETYDQKMNVAIASGNLPDMFVVNATQLQQLANAGELADLAGVFDQYGSELTKKLVNSDGGLGLQSATFDGKLLALPGVSANLYNPSLLWIRTDWLKKLNLPEPKTMQDVFAISDAFVNQDPDGDGKKNTIGLGLTKDLYTGGIGLISGFANGYHAYPWIWVKNADGTVQYGSTKPEMKAALGKLQELYKNGQIDKEFGVKDGAKIGESIASNKLGIMYGENWMPYFPIIDGKKQNPGMEWKPYALPSIDDQPAKGGVAFATTTYFAVNKNFKHPEAIVKLLNMQQEKMYQAPVDPNSPFNIVQDGDTRIETYKYAVVSSTLGNDMIADSITKLKDALEKDDPEITKGMLAETDKFEPIRAFNKDRNMDYWPQARQFDAFQQLLNMYNNDGLVTSVLAGQTKTMGENWAALVKLEKETFTKIIMGAAPIDEFDKFVDTWNALGGKEITQEVTDMVNK
ncbi:extracellular solute-binding protein [Paenibacillus lycopersici]|nr:extracellular solute-binding protein [Paenibacillus lycopersici]